MVFVIVGNATQGFRRLLDAVDHLAGQQFFGDETVSVQWGNNRDFVPGNCEGEPFLSMEKFLARIREADLIISHGGAGTLLHVFEAGKLPVVMPRQRKYRELVDDHQIELVEVLAAEGRVVVAYEVDELPAAILHARGRVGSAPRRTHRRMVGLVSNAIERLSRGG